MLLTKATLTLLALVGTLPLAAGSVFESADDPSNFINGVHVSEAFQDQLRKDYAALGWNASSLAAAPAPERAHDKHLARRTKAKTKAAAAAKKRFNYGGSTKVRGVNLGGWLVTEPWMSPSLYLATAQKHSNVVDEYTLCQQNGRAWCTAQLTAHYKSFITEADFAAIKAAGLNHVRLPIGFWAFDISGGEPYVQGQLPFLQQAVLWALKYNLSVVMDIHGVPGSQNGQDNSGHRGAIEFYSSANNAARAKAVLKALVAEFTKPAYGGVVTMYEPVNEPRVSSSSSALSQLKAYYTAAWAVVKSGTGAVGYTLLGDAFLGLNAWLSFMPAAQYANTAFDKHFYTVFNSKEYALSDAARVKTYCGIKSELAAMSKKHPVIVGEWTAAMTDCGQELAGISYPLGSDPIGLASRYGGDVQGLKKVKSCANLTRDGSTFSKPYKATLRKMWEAQVDTYEKYSAGWLMWAWKLEAGAADDWSYQAGLKYGWIPQNPTARQYPGQCK